MIEGEIGSESEGKAGGRKAVMRKALVPQFATSCLLLLMLFLKLALSADGVGACELQDCWDAYEQEMEAAGVRNGVLNPFDSPTRRERTLRRLCAAVRVFGSCVKNASALCLGDLRYYSTLRRKERDSKEFGCAESSTSVGIDSNERGEGIRDGNELSSVTSSDGGQAYGQLGASEEFDCRYQHPGDRGATYRYCAMFGDPHLRTFGGEYQTCRVRGAWPLVDNDYVTVQVTSGAVGGAPNGNATAIGKLTIVIKRHADCGSAQYLTYQAQSGELPSTFDDGRTSARNVDLIQHQPSDDHVEIFLRYIDTSVLVRRIGDSYSVGIALPEGLLAGGVGKDASVPVQLCTVGCPRSERIDLGAVVRRLGGKVARTPITTARGGSGGSLLAVGIPDEGKPTGEIPAGGIPAAGIPAGGTPAGGIPAAGMSREQARARCRELALTGYYLESCVFDLVNTGNVMFSAAARDVQTDVRRFIPDSDDLVALELNEAGADNAGSGVSGAGWIAGFDSRRMLLLALAACLTVADCCRVFY